MTSSHDTTSAADASSERHGAEEALRASEERFSKMFRGHSAVQLIIDPTTGAIVDANEAAAAFYGWSVPELQRKRIQEINDLPPEVVKERMAVAAGVQNARFEFRHRRADGSTREVEVYSNKVEVGGTAFLYSIIHDISELRAAHGRLRHAEEFARFGHWEVSLDDRTIRASEGAMRIYGLASQVLPLSVVQGCALPEHRPGLDLALRELIERNVPYDQEFRIRRASDGAIVHVHSMAEYDATTRRVFGVVQDISERKRSEEERERLVADLQRTVEQVKTLTGIVPICMSCKKIRDDEGFWEQVEAYVARHTDARFSHGICPDCLERLYPDE